MASATVANTIAPSRTWVAPDAASRTPFFGQPFFGATSRSSDSPKLAMARATMPMFSASCGSTRMATGAGDIGLDLSVEAHLIILVYDLVLVLQEPVDGRLVRHRLADRLG